MQLLRGTLFTCDAPVKQIILALDEQEKCIIEDLDEQHCLIANDKVEWLKAELERELEKNTWRPTEDQQQR